MNRVPRLAPVPATRTRNGLLTMLRTPTSRRRGRRGSLLLEALICMFVISLLVAAFTVSAISATKAQRSQDSVDIATEAAHGQLEKAKSLSWAELGFYHNQVAATETTDKSPATYDGHDTVLLDGSPTVGGALEPATAVTIKGRDITLRTYITWLVKPAAADGFGTKRITVVAKWNEEGRDHQMTYQADRSSTINEAAPATAIPSGFGNPVPSVPTPTATPSGTATAPYDGFQGYGYGGFNTAGASDLGDRPSCPTLTVATDEGEATLTWDDLGSASYKVSIDGNLVATVPSGTDTYTRVLPGGNHTFAVTAVVDGLESTGCGSQTAYVPPPIIPGCPTVYQRTGGYGTIDLAWYAGANAEGYNVYVNNSLIVSTTDLHYQVTGITTNGWKYIRVTSTRKSAESTWCPTYWVYAYSDAPTCPSTYGSYGGQNAAYLTWGAADRAAYYNLYVDGKFYATSYGPGSDVPISPLTGGYHYFRIDTEAASGTTTQCGTFGLYIRDEAPACPTVTTSQYNHSYVVVSWTAADRADRYYLYVDGSYYTSSNYPQTNYYVYTGYGTHTIRVDTYNYNGGGWTTCGNVTQTVDYWPPSCPSWSAWGGAGYATASWNYGSYVSDYDISLDGGDPVTYTYSTSRSWSNLDPGSHTFTLRVRGPGGTTDCGTRTVNVTPPPPTCPTITGSSYDRSTGEVKLWFNEVPNATSYTMTGRASGSSTSSPLTGTVYPWYRWYSYTVAGIEPSGPGGSTYCGNYFIWGS